MTQSEAGASCGGHVVIEVKPFKKTGALVFAQLEIVKVKKKYFLDFSGIAFCRNQGGVSCVTNPAVTVLGQTKTGLQNIPYSYWVKSLAIIHSCREYISIGQKK